MIGGPPFELDSLAGERIDPLQICLEQASEISRLERLLWLSWVGLLLLFFGLLAVGGKLLDSRCAG